MCSSRYDAQGDTVCAAEFRSNPIRSDEAHE
jgi:hypothetical protein